MSVRVVVSVGVVIGTAACGSDAPPRASFEMIDSAGVEVVVTSLAVWPDGGQTPWRLEPVSEFGELDGTEPYLFGSPVGVALLPTGGVVVADEQSSDLRLFSDLGAFQGRVGGRGEGPGEFMWLEWVDVCGGLIVASDRELQRLTTFDLDGALVETRSVTTPDDQGPFGSKCLPDGSLLAVGWEDSSVFSDLAEGVHFFSLPADVWRLVGPDSVISIGSYIATERVTSFNERGGGSVLRHPFGRAVAFDGTDDRIVIGTSERLQLEIRTLDGALVRVLRGPDTELVIDDEFLRIYREAELSDRDDRLRATLAEGDFPMPERYPAYTEILVDDDGFTWVERFVLPWATLRSWGVFGPDGAFLGHVEFPLDFQLTDVARDRAAGVATDSLGVSRVRVYAVERQLADSVDRETRSN